MVNIRQSHNSPVFDAGFDEDFCKRPSPIRGWILWFINATISAKVFAFQKVNILIFTKNRKVNQFRVPRFVHLFSIFLLVSCMAYLLWIIPDYKNVKAKMPLLARLQYENAQQRMRLVDLADRIKHMSNKIGQHREQDRRLMVMTNFEEAGNGEYAPLGAVGGSEPTVLSSEETSGQKEIQTRNKAPIRKAITAVAPDRGNVSSTGLDKRKAKTIRTGDNIAASPEKKGSSYPYSLQLGSYRTLERANNAVSEYNTKGISAYWVKADLEERGVWYRVLVGHFKNMEKANKFRQEHKLTKSVLKNIQYANLIGIYDMEGEYLDRMKSLKELGYFPYVIEEEGKGIRLFTGAFHSKSGAEKLHLDLQSKGFQNEIVKR